MEGAQAGGGGFQLVQFAGAELANVGHAVGGAALGQVGETIELRLPRRDDDLAAALVGDVVLLAELQHLLGPADRQPGLGGAGAVVEPAVDDAAVVAGLMLADIRFFLQHDDGNAGEALHKRQCGGESNDAAADHGDVVAAGVVWGRAIGAGLRGARLVPGALASCRNASRVGACVRAGGMRRIQSTGR